MYDPEIEEWKGEPFVVGVPANPESLWRLVTSDAPTKDDFLPDCDVRDRPPTEDWCSYLGFSAWRLPEQARGVRRAVEPVETGRGDPPFTHMVEIRLWPKKRHACARVGFEAGSLGRLGPSGALLTGSKAGRRLPDMTGVRVGCRS
jgi:hypothetical protein